MSDSTLFSTGALFSTDYLQEAIKATQAYRAIDVVDVRTRLMAIAAAFPQSAHTNESQTEDDFIWPVLTVLGWSESLRQQNLTVNGRDDVPDGVLFADAAAKAAANAQTEQWRRYAYGLAVVESKRWARPLDRATGRDETTAPSTQMLRYLRRIDDTTHGKLRWGVLTNGNRWRLYWAGARSISEEFLEIDLGQALGLEENNLFADEETRDHWLRVFAVMFSRKAFLREGVDQQSFHDRARAEAAFYEERVAANLSRLVFDQVFPDLARALAVAAPESSLDEIRNAALILLYRLLFLLYAEDRNLLPVSDPRYEDYALRPLRLEIGERVTDGDVFSATAAKVWSHISDLARIIDKGDGSVGIPPYNGGLFSTVGTPLLAGARIPDSVMAPALDALSYERASGQRRYINYRDLSVQQLGSIYERLLEFEIVREPGEIGDVGYLTIRPNLFARKNSGSYYTPDELVGLLLNETLEPLVTECHEAFRLALAALNSKDGEDLQRRILRDVDPAEAILSLRVCDPAMGSGHFLVSLVDTLADHVLEAMAEAAALGKDIAYVSPLADKIETIRATILKNAKTANWTIDEKQLDDRHIVRRMVLKRCVYGVDKNPMAVELAKVALWLHTFTVGAPLSFIDHHLHAGDSLFGLWVRDAIDKASAQGGELLWNAALRNAQRSAEAMKTIEALTDIEIGEAHRSAAMYEDVELMTGELDGFVSFVHALDWLNLDRAGKALVRLWLDGQFGDPIPIARGRKPPESGKARAEDVEAFTEIWRRTRSLITEERFLNWQITFPGVWDHWASKARTGGFDAVVGNPPWDMMEFEEVPWFEARDRGIAFETNRAARGRRIAALKASEAPLWLDYKKATKRAADATRMARSSAIYSKLNRGRINLFKLFVERARTLVKPNGMVGLLTPSGIASDLSASAFFREVATGGNLKALYDFENKKVFFPDVHASFKFCALAFSPERTFEAAKCGFFLHSVDEIADPQRTFALRPDDFAQVNPNTGTAPTFRSRRDMEITTAIYARLPVLALNGLTPTKQYSIHFAQMLNMSADSDKFVELAELEGVQGAWRVRGNRYKSGDGEWLPVFEGKMVQAYDHRAADIVIEGENLFRPGQGESLTSGDHADPDRVAVPRYWIKSSDTPWEGAHEWCMAFKDITASTNMRTSIAAIIPRAGAGHTLPVAFPDEGAQAAYVDEAPLLLGKFNSLIFDYLARQKVHSTHLSWYLLDQLPVIPPSGYARSFGEKSAADIVRRAVLELTYTSHDMEPFARDMNHVGADGKVPPPFVWDEARRLNLRAKLDALYFILYGVFDPANPTQSRDDIRYIYSTFPIVEREEVARWGSYRSRDMALAWINALMAGQPDAEIAG
ncbi:Eco57I restriction-modification methylase domain-containing protein [Caulobacter sp. NIBR2454]|uniref:Eco57I restriction-modification methylase domain-containing protein n=1 Tax=Caulobacter sp. NIBR2454 TaxID=3015996 RepID=UPI0022B74022|nr:hypothetical protein [Caulobacter sp. NIBR2454]